MNLKELYAKIPVEQHSQIKVAGDRVFVVTLDGSVTEYLNEGGELILLSDDRPTQKLLDRIAKKLGV